MDTFRKQATELNKSKINETHLVLIDKISKRSLEDYSGRNDNNTIVTFSKLELPHVESLDDYKNLINSDPEHVAKALPQIGDYVACKIVSATSQSLRAIPLYSCKLQTFDKIKNLNRTWGIFLFVFVFISFFFVQK